MQHTPLRRSVVNIITGQAATDGAGVHLTRVFGHRDTSAFDPFLMLDAFDSTHPEEYRGGFPWHPHRGMETITYLIEGHIEHGDSLGNQGSIRDGDCQWMTAGSGIIHQEMPQPTSRLFGAQLWLNLPAKDKMTQPHYQDIRHADIPVQKTPSATIKIIAGAYDQTPGGFQGQHVSATYLDVEILPGGRWSLTTEASTTVFAYLLSGSGFFDEQEQLISSRHAILFGLGETIEVQAGENGVRFLLLEAQPLGEPVAWGGPIVMNTPAELTQAFEQLDHGTFLASSISI